MPAPERNWWEPGSPGYTGPSEPEQPEVPRQGDVLPGHYVPEPEPEPKLPDDGSLIPPPLDTNKPEPQHVQTVKVDETFVVKYEPGTVKQPPGEGATQDDGRTPTHVSMSVDLGDLAAVESTHLAAIKTLTDEFTALRTTVTAVGDTIFGQQAPDHPYDFYDTSAKTITHEMYPDPIRVDPEAIKFVAAIRPAMESSLDHVGHTLELFGALIQAMETTGDGYASADNNSVFTTE